MLQSLSVIPLPQRCTGGRAPSITVSLSHLPFFNVVFLSLTVQMYVQPSVLWDELLYVGVDSVCMWEEVGSDCFCAAFLDPHEGTFSLSRFLPTLCLYLSYSHTLALPVCSIALMESWPIK